MGRFFLGMVAGGFFVLLFQSFLKPKTKEPSQIIVERIEQTNKPLRKDFKVIDSLQLHSIPQSKVTLKKPSTVKLSLNSVQIKSLEDSLPLLEEQAAIRKTNEGWKFESLKNDSLFYAYGFRENDEVPEQKLKEYFSGNDELFYRFTSVMDNLVR